MNPARHDTLKPATNLKSKFDARGARIEAKPDLFRRNTMTRSNLALLAAAAATPSAMRPMPYR
jgi:hypothetical protein